MTDRHLDTVFFAFLALLAGILLCATIYVKGGYQQRDRDALALVTDDGCEHREHYRPCATCGTYDENGAMVAPPME